MKVLKIYWKKLWKDERIKYICKEYASGDISFSEMKDKILFISPILSDAINDIDTLGEKEFKHRLYCSLNGSGTPITGLRRYVDPYPFP